MTFKSKAQRRKFAELLVKGEITPEAYERWNRDTGRAELPERVKPKRKRSKARSRPKARATTKRTSKTKANRRSARRSR